MSSWNCSYQCDVDSPTDECPPDYFCWNSKGCQANSKFTACTLSGTMPLAAACQGDVGPTTDECASDSSVELARLVRPIPSSQHAHSVTLHRRLPLSRAMWIQSRTSAHQNMSAGIARLIWPTPSSQHTHSVTLYR